MEELETIGPGGNYSQVALPCHGRDRLLWSKEHVPGEVCNRAAVVD